MKTCAQPVKIAGLSHLVWRCTREPDHAGPHAISLGAELLGRLKGFRSVPSREPEVAPE